MMLKKQSNSSHRNIAPYIMAILAAAVIGCLDEAQEPDDEVNIEGMEACETPEAWRCNGDVSELCRMANGNLLWRPMEDCANVPGGFCEDPGDGTQPVCTGNYWDSGYCPGGEKPAAPDCGGITGVGCCENNVDENISLNLWCDETTGTLYCEPCWGYYYTYCTWFEDKASAFYGCTYLENGADGITEDPSGENPIDCGGAADADTDTDSDTDTDTETE